MQSTLRRLVLRRLLERRDCGAFQTTSRRFASQSTTEYGNLYSTTSSSWEQQQQQHQQKSLSSSSSSVRLSHMTLRQLQIELFRFGRRRVHEHQALTHLIEELMQRPQEATERNKFIRILVVRDALYLSHLAGLHGHCTELFLSTMRLTPNALPLSDAVVDSAFSHGSAAVMSAIVDASVSRLQHSPDDAGTEAALYRLVWLCALKSLELDEERAVLIRRSHGSQQQHVRSRSSSTSAVVSPQQEILELQEKRLQYENVARSAFVTLANANPSIASTRSRATETSLSTSSSTFRSLSSSNSSMDDAATATASSTSSATAARPLSQLTPFDELWHSATRFARYHYTDDGGEAQFYKHLYDNNWLRNKQAPQMVSVLIRSCNRSQNVKLVKEYFTHFVKHVMERAAAEEEEKESQLLAAQNSEGSSYTTDHSTSDDVIRGGDDLKDQNDNTHRNKTSKFQEVVVHTYFQTLLNCRAYQAVVDTAENLFTHVDAYTPSASILAVVSRAAGEVRNHRLAMHCASLLFASTTTAASQQHQNDEGTFGGSSGGGDAGGIVAEQQQDPSSSAASEKSLPSSYEVFVTLMALAKCHATSFFPLLEKVRAIAAISPNAEETLCLQLHYLRRSPHIASETNRILADLRAKPIASVTLLTVRNMTLILLLLQHCNHDQFLEVYRDYIMRSSEKSHLWCLVLLQWAELRRYTLSNADRDFVIRTLRELQKEEEGEQSKSTTNSKRGSSSSSTTSLWHTVTSWIAPSAGDTVLQRGAVAIFLADCCAMGRLHRTEAFATALSSSPASSLSPSHGEDDRTGAHLLPQWPLDDSSLRFTLKPSGKLSSGLRHNALAPDSLVRYNSIDVSSGLGPSMLDAQIMMHKGWEDDEGSAIAVGNGGGTQQLYTPRGEELSLILSSRAMVQSMMSFSN